MKIIFNFIALNFLFFFFHFSLSAQENYKLKVMPTLNLFASDNSTLTSAALETFSNVPGATYAGYRLEKKADSAPYLVLKFTKNGVPNTIALELQTSTGTVTGGVYESSHVTITHTCTGGCTSGVGPATLTNSCNECDFTYRNGVIVGCECKQWGGCCNHTKTASGIKNNDTEMQALLGSLIK